MHDCPRCDSACYCDLEDHYQPAPHDCSHDCQEYGELEEEFDQFVCDEEP